MKMIELRNQSINAEKGQAMSEEGVADIWKVTCQDKQTGDVIFFTMNKDLRDELVRQLTGGVVIAPQMTIPRGKPH